MKVTILAAMVAVGLTGQATAQSAEALTAQLANTVMNLRGYEYNAQTPTGERVRLRLFDSGAAQMRFSAFEGDEETEDWALWRVNERNQFCTTYAIRGDSGVLIPAAAEDCLDFRIDGNRIGLNFYSSSGNIDRYSGTFRAM